MLDYDLRIVYDLIMQIVSRADATTITQPNKPDTCEYSALHLFAAPTQLVNISPIGSAADASEAVNRAKVAGGALDGYDEWRHDVTSTNSRNMRCSLERKDQTTQTETTQ